MKMLLQKKSGGFFVILIMALLVFGLAAPSQGKVVIRYSNFSPRGSFACAQMDRWAEEIKKRTDGEVTVDVFVGGTILSSANTYDGILSGIADAGMVCSSYQPGLFPMTDAMDLPWGWANSKVAAATALEKICVRRCVVAEA